MLKVGRQRAGGSLMVGTLLAPEIKTLIDARDFNGLRDLFKEWPPADIAEVILDLPDDEQVIIFRVLPAARSEERRVGKECRCRWSQYHEKKKKRNKEEKEIYKVRNRKREKNE